MTDLSILPDFNLQNFSNQLIASITNNLSSATDNLFKFTEYYYSDHKVCSDLFVIGLSILFSYLFYKILWILFKKSEHRSLYISSIHATIVSCYALSTTLQNYNKINQITHTNSYLCLSTVVNMFLQLVDPQNFLSCDYNDYFCLSTVINWFKRITILNLSQTTSSCPFIMPSLADLCWIIILSLSLVYSFYDMEIILRSKEACSKWGMILMHHICMFVTMLIMLLFYITGDRSYDYLMRAGFLMELSTPVLNYLKITYKNGKSVVRLYPIFIILYFLCRPVVLYYITTNLNDKVVDPFQNPYLTITYGISILFFCLNCFWMYLLILKYCKQFA